MSSVDDVYAAASGAESPLEEAQGQATMASEKTSEAATALEDAKSQAESLVELTSAIGIEAKTSEADAVRAEAKGLAARTAAAAQRLGETAGELAAIKQQHTELLARIQALGG